MKKILSIIIAIATLLSPFMANAQAVTFPNRGGTGTTTIPTFGQVLMGQANGTYGPVATTSLGIVTNPGGSNTQLQFNNSGVFGGSANLVWNNSLSRLTATNASSTALTSGTLYLSGLTSGRIPFATTSGMIIDSPAFTLASTSNRVTLSLGNANNYWRYLAANDSIQWIVGADQLQINANGANGMDWATPASSIGFDVGNGQGVNIGEYGVGTDISFKPFGTSYFSSDIQFNNASSTNHTILGNLYLPITSSVLGVDANGRVIATTTAPGGVTSVTGTYPIISSGGTTPGISLAFGTTTSNTWAGIQTFNNASTTNQSISGFLNVAGQTTLANSSSTNESISGFLNVSGKTTLGNASTTNVTASNNLNVTNKIINASLGTGQIVYTGPDKSLISNSSGTFTANLLTVPSLKLTNLDGGPCAQRSILTSDTSGNVGADNYSYICGDRIASDYGFITQSDTGGIIFDGEGDSFTGIFNDTGDVYTLGAPNSLVFKSMGASGFVFINGEEGTGGIADFRIVNGDLYLGTNGNGNLQMPNGNAYLTNGNLSVTNGTLSVGGKTTLTNASSTNQTISGYLNVAGKTTLGLASSTNQTISSNLWLPSITSSILAVDATGKVIATTTSSGGVASVTGTYPIVSSGGTNPAISIAFGTTTSNTWAGTQTFGAITNTGTTTSLAFVKSGGTSSQFLKADGTIDSSTYLTTSAGASAYVPYTGATGAVNLGSQAFTTSGQATLANASTTNVTASGYLNVAGLTTLVNASTTVLSAGTICLTGDLPCRTTWPTGGGSGTISTSTALANTQMIYATGLATIGSEAALTYNSTTDKFTVVNASTTNTSAANVTTATLNATSTATIGGTATVAGNVGIKTTDTSLPLAVGLANGEFMLAGGNIGNTIGNCAGYAMGMRTGGQYMKNAIAAVGTGDGNNRQDTIFLLNNTANGNNVGCTDEKMRLTYTGKLGIGTTTPSTSLDVNGGIYSELVTPATSTTMTMDFTTGNNQKIMVGSANITVNITNANNVLGKCNRIYVVAPATGVIGTTTFAGSTASGPLIWNGGINPGSSVVNASTDEYEICSMASSTPFLGAKLLGTY